MSVAIGNIGSSAQLIGANSELDAYTASVTVSSGSVLLIAHMYAANASVTAGTPTSDDGSSVTALLAKSSAGSGEHHLNLWWCTPTAGSRTVSLTQSQYARANLILVELTGADVTTPFGTPVTIAGDGNAPSVNVSSLTSNDLALAFSLAAGCDAGFSLIVPGRTPGSGQTSLFDRSANSAQGNYRDTYSSISSKTGTGTVAVSYTYTGAPFYLLAGVRVIAASGGGGGSSRATVRSAIGLTPGSRRFRTSAPRRPTAFFFGRTLLPSVVIDATPVRFAPTLGAPIAFAPTLGAPVRFNPTFSTE